MCAVSVVKEWTGLSSYLFSVIHFSGDDGLDTLSNFMSTGMV